MAAKEPATTFAAPAVAMAVELEEEPVLVGVTLEVNVVPVAVEVLFTPLPAVGVKVGKVVGAEVVGAVVETLEERDEEALVDETDAELAELLTGTLTLLLLLLLMMELELELEPLEAEMWNGNEYWKVAGFESRLIFKP